MQNETKLGEIATSSAAMQANAYEERQKAYTNRELSWLQFNERVLEESEDTNVPLFERLRFIAIFQSNLDEFFMVRVGSLFDQMLLKKTVLDSKTRMTAAQQLIAIYSGVRLLLARKEQSYKTLMNELSSEHISQVNLQNLSSEEFDYLRIYFEKEILPLVSPQIIDKRQPFPFLKNKEIYVAVHLQSKGTVLRLGIIPTTGYFNRLVYLPSANKGSLRFVPVEELIYFFAEKVFDRHQVLDKTIFRITRNADIDVEDEMVDVDFDYRDAMQELLKKRKKLSPVRLELQTPVNEDLLSYMCEKISVAKEQVFVDFCPLDLSFVFALEGKITNHEDLFFRPVVPQVSNQISERESMIAQIERQDILFHYPYNSIKPFIDLLNEAAVDKHVISIKITLYRVAKDSKVINALINAAEKGKSVSVVVELRARFDEENNIDWSKRLEEGGCNVIYGLPGYKVHSKLLLITRKIGNQIEYITQVGTGNYNEKTSQLYTDFSLMTAKKEIGSDASVVFNSLFMGTVVDSISHLLVAPLCFKPQIIELIDKEIAFARQGKPAQITLKMNSLTDKMLIDKLIEASCANVNVTMLVRGICCLKPRIKNVTENIKIYSIVGRFLEHSRVLIFGLGERQKIFISSADFMTRNTERRVEVAAPIYSEPLRKKITDTLDIMLNDTAKLREQNADGIYSRVPLGDKDLFNSQEYLYEVAYKQAVSPDNTKLKVRPVRKIKRPNFIIKLAEK